MKMKNWKAPDHWLKMTTIDAHTGGEPFRIITGGFPELPGKTILARRRYVKEHLDHMRTTLMWEPRGHPDMYGCIVTPPATPDADIGVLFMHNEGYSTQCGHGIIAITKVALETGLLPMTGPETTVRIDTPSGMVTAHARVEEGQVKTVYFQNVPSFVSAIDQEIDVPGLGRVRYDLAFGGAFYAYVQAEELGVRCTPEFFHELIEKGMAIKRTIMKHRPITHPFEEDLSFLYGTIFIGPPLTRQAHSRNVCIFADGEVDRSPTGSGLSGRLAIHHARGEIGLDKTIVVESIIDSCFSGRIVGTTTFGPHAAIIPEIEGTAHITGRQEFLVDPEDPLHEGFLLR